MTQSPPRDRRSASRFAPMLLAAVGCAGAQSALDPQGTDAARILELTRWLALVALAVYAAVVGLLVAGVIRHRRGGPPAGERSAPLPGSTRHALTIGVAGVAVPAVILAVTFVASARLTAALHDHRRPADLTILVTGHQWWWDVRYVLTDAGAVDTLGAAAANELYIPAGRHVRLLLRAADVIHSLWIPRLGGKVDLVPGRITELWLHAERPGEHRGQCAEYCGLQHTLMSLEVVVLPPAAFEAWLVRERGPAPEPDGAVEGEGRDAFVSACGRCHTVRGTLATGRLGPDLTRLASRRRLAAGALPNTREALDRWIAMPDRVKPGSLMPAVPLSAERRAAIVAWLAGLH